MNDFQAWEKEILSALESGDFEGLANSLMENKPAKTFADEDCPRGTECPVHFRNDEHVTDEITRRVALVTYVGEYVVFTDDNPALLNMTDDEMFNLETVMMLGILSGKTPADMRAEGHDVPFAYATQVFKLEGADSTLAEVVENPNIIETTYEDDFFLVQHVHDAAVDRVRNM